MNKLDVITFEIEPYFVKFGLVLIGDGPEEITIDSVKRKLSKFSGVHGEKANELLGLINKTITSDGKYGATFATNGEIIVVIKLGKIDTLSRAISILVHELSHVCVYVFKMKSVPVNDQTHEPFAYLIQNLFEKTNSFVEKNWKKIHCTKNKRARRSHK